MSWITLQNGAATVTVIGDAQSDLAALGYAGWTLACTLDALPPDGAELIDGAWIVPLATMKARKSAAVDQALAAAFLGGFTPSAGPLAGHVLQVRGDTDRTNWLTSQAAYSAEVAAGNGAAVEAAFRDAANVTTVVSYSDGLAALLAMAAWGKALFQNSWALKDAIAAAADEAALEAVDVTAGWA